MNKNFKNVGTVHTHTCNLENIKNKINERDICTNASNCGVQFKNETDNKTGRQRRRPLQIPTQKNANVKECYTNECCTEILNNNTIFAKNKLNTVGADASVRPQKEHNQNKYKIKIFNKIKSDIVGVGVPDDPKEKNKHINKITSNVPTSNIQHQTSNFKFPTSNSAITLIALIITIIVLLILAGVTLNMVMGDSGLFSKANNAKNKTEVAQYEEELRMCILELQTDSATNGTTFNMETIKNKLVEKVKELENTDDIEFPTEESETKLEGTYKGYEFYVDDKYAAHIGDKATGIRLTTSLNPSGWTKQNVIATIIIKSNNGLKKIVPQGESEITLNGEKEYTITKSDIAENTTFTYEVTDSQNNTQTKTAIINTIDKEPPQDFQIEAQVTEEGIQITGTTTDNESGIDRYEYYAKKSTEGNYTKYDSNPITGLTSGTYDIKVIAYDKAENTKESVLNSFKVTIPIKRTDISAADIKNNPEGYYGQEVNYTSANGQNDWKIFHSDGTNIYLITGNYVKVTDDNGKINSQKLNTENTKIKKSDATANYRVNCINPPTFNEIADEIIPKFKINTNVFNINSHKSNYNAQFVSTFLNQNYWNGYIDNSKGSNQIAIGGPTIQLWIDSWNARYPDQEVYCDSANKNGYFVGKSSGSVAMGISLNQNNGEELYFLNFLTDGNETVDYYWLASPSAFGSSDILYVHHYREIKYNSSTCYNGGLRPVVCLQSNISLK